jgi:sensor c-di-GMP phosphodiesterase-like protein
VCSTHMLGVQQLRLLQRSSHTSSVCQLSLCCYMQLAAWFDSRTAEATRRNQLNQLNQLMSEMVRAVEEQRRESVREHEHV